MYNVKRIDYCNYSITGENIDVKVCSENPFTCRKPIDKATGKGSKKIKDQLPILIQEFVKNENNQKIEELKRMGKEFTNTNPKVKDGCLYDVTLNFSYDSQGYQVNTEPGNKSMVSKQLKEYIRWGNVLGFTEVKINNTDIYGLGRFIASGRGEEVREDEHIFVLLNGIRITGLTLKEWVSKGRVIHTLYKDNRGLETIIDEAKMVATGKITSPFGAIGEEKKITDINMYERLMKEINRAKKSIQI